MDKINFQNGKTKLNKAMFDALQNNIAKEVDVNSQSVSLGKVYKVGRLVCLTIAYTANITNLATNTAYTIATLEEKYRPNKVIASFGVIKDRNYKALNNSYIQIRPSGAVEIYQNSGSAQNIVQILATIVYMAAS